MPAVPVAMGMLGAGPAGAILIPKLPHTCRLAAIPRSAAPHRTAGIPFLPKPVLQALLPTNDREQVASRIPCLGGSVEFAIDVTLFRGERMPLVGVVARPHTHRHPMIVGPFHLEPPIGKPLPIGAMHAAGEIAHLLPRLAVLPPLG